MKVEVENCTACGAKNSRYVQKCYRCGAALPWAPDYTPPVQPATPAQPASTSHSSPAVTVTVPPGGAPLPDVYPAPETEEKPLKKIPKTTMLIIGGGVGAIVLIALVVVITLTVAKSRGRNGQSPIPTPVAPAAPAPGVAPGGTPAPGQPKATAQPGATAQPSPAAQPNRPATKPGPTLADVEKKYRDPANAFTSLQKENYWKSVQGTQVIWQGEVQDVKPDGLSLLCKGNAGSYPVEVTLDGTQSQLLGGINKKQAVKVKGLLKDKTANGFTLEAGQLVLSAKP